MRVERFYLFFNPWFHEEIRAEDFCLLFLVLSLFLVIYLWADGAATRPWLFNLIRFAVSLAAGMLLGVAVVDMLMPDDRR